MKVKYIKLLIIGFFTVACLTTFYVFYTSDINKELKTYESNYNAKKAEWGELVKPSEAEKKVVKEIQLSKEKDMGLSDLISRFKGTKSNAIKSAIIKKIARNYLNHGDSIKFFTNRFSSESELIQKIIIKDIVFSKLALKNEKIVKMFKIFLHSNTNHSDQVYIEILLYLAKNEQNISSREQYIEKAISLVPILEDRLVARSLRSLLNITKGREDVLKLINLKLKTNRTMDMIILAMTDLVKYDTTWLDENRNYLSKNPNEHIRAFFMQNLKNYCPSDYITLLRDGLFDKSKTVVEYTLQELRYYGVLGRTLLRDNYNKVKIDKKRKDDLLSILKAHDIDKNLACQN